MARRRRFKAWSPPGSLPDIPKEERREIHISLCDWDSDSFEELDSVTLEECIQYLDREGVTWINITGVDDVKLVEQVGKSFKIHPLLIEDIATLGERVKIESQDSNLFLVMHLLENNGGDGILDQQVSMIVGPHYLVTFFERETPLIQSVRDRVRRETSRLRKNGADYLAYTFIDMIVDSYFLILNALDDRVAELEEELMHSPDQKTLHKIEKTKREMMTLRRTIWPTREMISTLRRLDSPLIQKETQLYLTDVYDHTIHAMETLEGFRDIVGGMLDIYLSTISQRLNEIMKVLTVVATLFAPLTFITGFYGMNFVFIPGLDSNFGFITAVFLMLSLAFLMLYVFYRKKWL